MVNAPAPAPGAALGGSKWAWVALLLILAVQATLLWIGHAPEPRVLFGDELMYWEGAGRLASGEEWSPEPLWPPLQFHFLARLTAVVGASRIGVELSQLLLLIAVSLLVRALTRRLTQSDLAAGVAAVLVLVYPPMVTSAHYLWPETLHLLLMLGSLWILIERGTRPLWLTGAGILLGLALATKSLLAPFVPILLLPLALRGTIFQRIARPAVVLAAIVVTVLLGFGRGGSAPGASIGGSAAFNLWVGLNDRSPVSLIDPVVNREYQVYLRSGSTAAERDRVLWGKIGSRLKEQGPWSVLTTQVGRQYFRLFDRDSFFTVQLPGGVVGRSGRGYVRTPKPVAALLRGWSYGLYALVLVTAAIGLSVVPHRGRRWLLVALGFVIYNLAIFALLHVKSRYRIQFLPVLFLYSGCAVAWGAARFGRWPKPEGWSDEVPSWAWALAGALLLLAFGGRAIHP